MTEELARHYDRLQLAYHTAVDDSAAKLVVPDGNAAEPFHRWFHLKEGFSHRLLPKVIADAGLAGRPWLSVIDPFAGVGTSLVSALESNVGVGRWSLLGFEVNPWLQLVASVKVRALCSTNRAELAAQLADLAASLDAARHPVDVLPPTLSTFHDPDHISREYLERLLAIRERVERVPLIAESSHLARDLAIMCLGGAVLPAMRLRRDGRALRRDYAKDLSEPLTTFRHIVSLVLEDLRSVARRDAHASVILGDGRSLGTVDVDCSADLILFSPPYPNNIDYTEVYKLEAWLLGLINDDGSFIKQRLRTVRSHPSVDFGATYEFMQSPVAVDISSLVAPVLAAIPPGRYSAARRRMVLGYVDDMYRVFLCSYKALRPGGWLAYVVGNSVHGRGEDAFVIAADLIMARLAELAGFHVRNIAVARRLGRRHVSNPYARESVVYCRRPG